MLVFFSAVPWEVATGTGVVQNDYDLVEGGASGGRVSQVSEVLLKEMSRVHIFLRGAM